MGENFTFLVKCSPFRFEGDVKLLPGAQSAYSCDWVEWFCSVHNFPLQGVLDVFFLEHMDMFTEPSLVCFTLFERICVCAKSLFKCGGC